MKKRILSIVLTLCLALSLLPATALAVVPYVTVGGVTLNRSTPYWKNGATAATSSETDYNAYFDATNATLTLKNATITGPAGGSGDTFGIFSNYNLAVKLEGTNTVTGGEATGSYSSYGISAVYALTISGSGSLTAAGGTVANGTATGGTAGGGGTATGNSIGLSGSSITISGGTVTATGAASALSAAPTLADVTAQGSTNIDGTGAAAYASGSNGSYLWFKSSPAAMAVTNSGTTTYYANCADGWNAAVGGGNTASTVVKLLADWTAEATSDTVTYEGKSYSIATSFGAGAGFGFKDETNEGYIRVPTGKTVTLDLNGHNIDRALKTSQGSELCDAGWVILICADPYKKTYGSLTLQDTSSSTPANKGMITGGYNGYSSVSTGGIVNQGTFILNSGRITGNRGGTWGGGVYNTGTFTMNGGEISGNSISGSGNWGCGGAGVYNGSIFNMTGGTICGNTIHGRAGDVCGGSGVCTKYIFNMSGGTVSGNNTVGASGGGVGFYQAENVGVNGNIQISGTAKINGNYSGATKATDGTVSGGTPDNLRLKSDTNGDYAESSLKVSGALSSGAYIGVSTDATPTIGNPVSVALSKTDAPAYTIVDADSAFFHSDSDLYKIAFDSSTNTVKLKAKPVCTFDVQGYGTAPDKEFIDESTHTVSLPTAPTADGYTFDGWYKAACTNRWSDSDTVTPDTDLTLYAKWTANSYTVAFNANCTGSSGTMDSQTFTYDAAQVLAANTFTRSGYSFDGWNTKADGSGTSYTDKASVSNLTADANGSVTLYAQWKSTYSGGGSTTGSTTNTTSNTTTNSDGSTTKTDTTTKTDSTGATTTTEVKTTTNTDGTTTKVETATTKKTDTATGAVTETTTQKTTDAAGSTTTVAETKTTVTDKTTGATTATVATATTAADGTTTKVETVKVAGGTDGITAEAKVETGKTGEAVATATVEAPATATTTTLPAAVVEAVTGADTAKLTVKVGEVSVALDKTAVEAVKATGGEAPTLSATPVAAKELPSDLQSATKAFDFKVSGKGVNFGGGSAAVSVPYTKTDSSKAVAVYHIDANGNKTRVYDVTLTAGKLNISTVGWSTYAVLEVAPLAFTDVSDTDWFCGSVQYAVDKGLFYGTSATTFSPNTTMTRAMLVTVLWRMAGSPKMDDYGYPYSDVNAVTSPYAAAIYWARAQNVVTGYSEDKFGPDDAVTREQMVSILYRYAKLKGYDTTQGGMSIREYEDYASISSYASEAMDWAVNAGLINGSDGKLLPQSGASRAQVAAILMRFGQNVVK